MRDLTFEAVSIISFSSEDDKLNLRHDISTFCTIFLNYKNLNERYKY